MKRVIILGLILMGGANISFGQPGDKKEKIESLKIGFITQQLDLTADEAQKFWPIYNQYDSELEAMRKQRKSELMNASLNFDTMSDEDISKVIDNEMNFKQQELDLRKKYIAEFKKVLPVKKVAKLLRAEQEFKMKVIKEMQNRPDGKNPPPPMQDK